MNPNRSQQPDDETRELEAFEAELRQVEPAPLDPMLEAQLLATLETGDASESQRSKEKIITPPSGIWRSLSSVAAAIALIAVLGWLLLGPGAGSPEKPEEGTAPGLAEAQNPESRPTPTKPGSGSEVLAGHQPGFQPNLRQSHFYDATPGKVRLDAQGRPVREVEYRYLDAQEWVHPETGHRFQFRTPRSERVVEPVEVF